jgi:hypothetical protein
VARGGGQLAQRPRRDVVERVDLPVRVVERDADDLALVLERQHVRVPLGAEHRVAVGPDVEQQPHALDADARQRRLVVGRVHDDLAPAAGRRHRHELGARHGRRLRIRAQRREAVVEDRDVEVRAPDLAVPGAGRVGAERAAVGRREERALLAVGRERDPLAGGRVEPALTHEAPRRRPRASST